MHFKVLFSYYSTIGVYICFELLIRVFEQVPCLQWWMNKIGGYVRGAYEQAEGKYYAVMTVIIGVDLCTGQLDIPLAPNIYAPHSNDNRCFAEFIYCHQYVL